MLGLAEYTIKSQDLFQLARTHENEIIQNLHDEMPKGEAVRVAQRAATSYLNELPDLISEGISDATTNAIDYYGQQLDIHVDNVDELIEGIVNQQFTKPYYGVSLNDRLKINKARLRRNIIRSAEFGTGYEGLKGLFTNPIPYGAQANLDRRILLAQMVKAEQDAAIAMANEGDVALIRWTLSAFHPKEDICDDLASAINQDVARYIEKNKLNLDPKGLYFPNELPHPPHPNCTCEYGMVVGKGVRHGPVKRTVAKVRTILRRLLRK